MPVMYMPGHEPREDAPGVDDKGGGGDDGGMLERIARLEAVIPTLATKEDLARLEGKVGAAEGNIRGELHKAINDQTWKLITWTTGLGAALVAAAFFVARSVH